MLSSDHPAQQPKSREELLERLRQNRQQQRSETEAWLHWEYSPEEWAQFDAVDYQAGRRILIALLVGLLCSVPFTLPFIFDPHVWGLGAVVGGCVISFTALMFWAITRAKARQRRRARQKADQPRRVTFAARGIWIAGAHFSFISLDKIRLTTPPAVLHFRFSEADNDGSVTIWRMRVLVPRGHETEAASLAQRYQAMLDDHEKQMEHFNNPPEPR